MNRFNLSEQSLSPNFIGSWKISPLICDDLVNYFESNESKQHPGLTGNGEKISAKNSTDISISPREILLHDQDIFKRYFKELSQCYEDYTDQWPFLNIFANKLQIGRFNLQRYESGQHFQLLHTERGSIDTLHRVFAWMTYLNDVQVEDGGATYFQHYDLEVQPSKGLTMIWPAEWTHAHQGKLLHRHSKYIITGWLHFSNDPTNIRFTTL